MSLWRKTSAAVAALVVAGVVRAGLVAPPRWPAPAEPRAVGSYHVHTERSHDARVSAGAWAAAARGRDLDFVLFTDHDAGYAPASLVDGVLLLPQTELSTPQGHLVALGGGPDAKLPLLAGHDAAARVAAAGAVPLAAHPASPKRPWVGDTRALAGVEPASLSASFDAWVRSPWVVAAPLVALVAAVNPAAALWPLYAPDAAALAAWDALPAPALGPCAGDGHGWIPLGLNLSAWHLVLDWLPRPRRGQTVAGEGANQGADEAAAHANAVLAELVAGRFHSVAGLLGREAGFRFVGRAHGKSVAAEGGRAAAAELDELEACLAPGAPGAGYGPFSLRLLHEGRVVHQAQARCLRWPHPAPGAWRVEAWAPLPRAWGPVQQTPVLYSNRLTVTAPQTSGPT